MGWSMGTEPHPDQAPAAAGGEPAGSDTERGGERHLAITIARDGTWFHEGRAIRRPELVALFARALHRADDGSYWLVTPVERGRIDVEDAPFLGVELVADGAGRGRRLHLRTNVGDWVMIDAAHPLHLRPAPDQPEAAAPVPYVEIRAGLEARLARPVYYELVELGETHRVGGRERFGVWSAGSFFALDDDH